ncbi:MAG: FecR family protein [Thermoanaerobaculia bacterium]|nr:FecR family protein [Thermoanaerobaculia bacterium]
MKSAFFGVIVLAAVAVAATPPAEPVTYRFDKVKSKVILVNHEGERRVAEGADAVGGDVVRTGWLGSALVSSPRHNARFEVLSSSEVTLGSDQPGVILRLERGRLKAMFDAFAGDEPRVVATPGALLAVRGTRYGVDVDSKGNASVVVFEGTVEVSSPIGGFEPFAVHAGQMAEYGRGRGPMMREAPKGMDERSWEQRGPKTMDGGHPEGGQAGDGPGMKDGSRSMPHGMGGGKRP